LHNKEDHHWTERKITAQIGSPSIKELQESTVTTQGKAFKSKPVPYMMERWQNEKLCDQPYNNVGAV
jgi:hypothetical protein